MKSNLQLRSRSPLDLHYSSVPMDYTHHLHIITNIARRAKTFPLDNLAFLGSCTHAHGRRSRVVMCRPARSKAPRYLSQNHVSSKT